MAPDAYADLLALRPQTWNYWGSTVALPPLLATLTGSQVGAVGLYLPLAVAGSLALLGWLAMRTDWGKLASAFTSLDWPLWLAGLSLYVLVQLASSLRWQLRRPHLAFLNSTSRGLT